MIRKALCAALASFFVTAPHAWAKADIVWQDQDARLSFWSMLDARRSEVVEISPNVDGQWRLAGVGDLDGDRAADLLMRNEAGEFLYWPMGRKNPTPVPLPGRLVGPEWRLAGIGDMNGDRKGDLIWQRVDGGWVEYSPISRGRIEVRVPVIARAEPGWTLAGVGDVNGDREVDFVWRHTDGRVHYWRVRQGYRIDVINIDAPLDAQGRIVGIGDVNSDDFDDIVWRNDEGRIHYWAMYDGQRMGDYDIDTVVDAQKRIVGIGDMDRARRLFADIPPHVTPFAVPVETLTLERARGRLMETAFTTGGYTFASSIDGVQPPPAGPNPSPWRERHEAMITYRFMKADGAVLNAGKCIQYQKMWSRFWDRANSLYTCRFETTSAATNAFEVFLPKIVPESNAVLTITVEDTDVLENRYKPFRARLRYGDAVYDALPIGVEPKREGTGRRVAMGYTIARDGKLVGRIDFAAPRGISSFDSLDRQSTITAPVAEADGREAVIFFAAQLLKMPEAKTQ